MAFTFRASMIEDYLTKGYLILRGIVPPALLRDLRVQADVARALAHELRGPMAQRIQPLVSYGEQLDLRPFQDYCELPELRDAMEQLLGPGYSHGQLNIMGLLVEPVGRPRMHGWHRDAVVEVPPAAYDEHVQATLGEIWHDLRYYNQVNCALYADGSTWFVPGSHLRQRDLPGEVESVHHRAHDRAIEGMSNAEAERYCLGLCRDFPGAVQVHLGPGDFMVYRNLAWHNGNYVDYQPRATIHDIVRYHDDAGWGERWRAVKQQAVQRLRDRIAAAAE